MFELLGVLGGAIARLAPLGFDILKKSQENKHELALLTMNVELERQRGINRAQEIQQMTDQAWVTGLVDAVKNAVPAPISDTGNFWLNFMNGINVSVRPILTYWWCIIMYTGHKALYSYVALEQDLPLTQIADLLYNEFDRGVVGSIIGFWFLDRVLRRRD
jgi:hypothetical protein